MANKKKVPELRFSAFFTEWQENKIGAITDRVKGNDGRMNLPTLTIAASIGWLNQLDRFYGNIAGNEQWNYTLLSQGELSYNHGNSKSAKYGTVFELIDYREALVPRVYHSFKATGKSNPSFIEYLFSACKLDKELSKIISSGARMDGLLNISYSDFAQLRAYVPSIEEQKCIGTFYRRIDSLIALYKCKHGKFCSIKKSMLEKMFPKVGSMFPEIRFTRFTEKWQERTLGDLCNITTGKLDANAMQESGRFDFYTSGIKKYKIDYAAFEGPAITIAGNGATVGFMHIADGKFNAYQRTYVLYELNENREFLFYAIGKVLPLKIKLEARAGNIPYIVRDMLTDLKIVLPSKDEQKRIAKFFTNLDLMISHQQQELDKLKNLKKALLQKMFI